MTVEPRLTVTASGWFDALPPRYVDILCSSNSGMTRSVFA
jgi:hypothetical protein